MIVLWTQDGALYDESLLGRYGFKLDNQRDIREISVYDSVTGEKTGEKRPVFDFVGFVTNADNDMLLVFPKHYRVEDKETDSRIIFDCITKHRQKKPDIYMGRENEERYKSNFPFSAFFGIYEYFQTYGLYAEDEIFIKPDIGGRISWKDTINKSEKYIISGNLLMLPLYYRKNYHFPGFITECMIYAIDYTISKFGVLLDARETGQNFPQFDYLEEREYVISILQQLKQQCFKDNVLTLLDYLIDFFAGVNIGGSYYLKHYSFSSIWEDMVTDYLCKYYKGVDAAHRVIFDKVLPAGVSFKKQTFHTNSAKPEQYIAPDHYGENGDVQMIFDAKYYTEIRGMNYKQIAYVFMLREMKEQGASLPKYRKTYSALILPSEGRDTKIHFQPSAEFGSCDDLIITEEYIDIREVMLEYSG